MSDIEIEFNRADPQARVDDCGSDGRVDWLR